jgi:hypothetical protein
MDNQPESLITVKELSWLGGLIDGEGTITIRYHERKNNRPMLHPVFTLPNTSTKIIEEAKRILQKNNIPFWQTNYKGTDKWKPNSIIEVNGIKRLLKFLPIIEEYLIEKRENSKLVRNWCEKREANYLLNRNWKYYDREDFETLIKIKKLHGHQDEIDYEKIEKLLKSSETTRGTSLLDEDIVRTA